MRKYLIVSLSMLTITPVVANTVQQSNYFIKDSNNKNLIQDLNQSSDFSTFSDSSKLDWASIQKTINDSIDNPKKLMSMLKVLNPGFSGNEELTQEQKDYSKNKVDAYIKNFQAKNFNSNQVTDYLLEENPDFNYYYNNIAEGAQTLEQKIFFKFFTNKLDLNLYGDATYGDVINIVQADIMTTFSVTNYKVTLSDESLFSMPLFQSDNQDSIIDFINDNLAIHVNVQVPSGKTYNQSIQLKNLKLDTSGEGSHDEIIRNSEMLFRAVRAYFSNLNPQDLGITLNDNYLTVYKNIQKKIEQRFPGIWWQVNLKLLANPEQHFYDQQILNDIANERHVIPFAIMTYQDMNEVSLNLPFRLSKQDVLNLMPSFFYQQENSPQDLALNTDNTFQDVLNKFNERLARLFPEVSVVSYLADPNTAATKLQKQFRPDQPNQKYKIKLGLKVKFEEGRKIYEQDFGVTDLYLENVDLGAEAKEAKQAYADLQELMEQIKTAKLICENLAVALAIAAAAFWAASWFFGITTAWAIACSVACDVVGTAVAGMAVAIVDYNQKISSVLEAGSLVLSINRLGVGIALIIFDIVVGVNVVLSATTWASMGLTLIGVATLGAVAGWISYYLEDH